MSECEWCKGTGLVKKPMTLARLTILEWLLVLGLIGVVFTFIAFFGERYGSISFFLLVGLFIGVPILQFGLWFFGYLGLIRRKVACVHCTGEVVGD